MSSFSAALRDWSANIGSRQRMHWPGCSYTGTWTPRNCCAVLCCTRHAWWLGMYVCRLLWVLLLQQGCLLPLFEGWIGCSCSFSGTMLLAVLQAPGCVAVEVAVVVVAGPERVCQHEAISGSPAWFWPAWFWAFGSIRVWGSWGSCRTIINTMHHPRSDWYFDQPQQHQTTWVSHFVLRGGIGVHRLVACWCSRCAAQLCTAALSPPHPFKVVPLVGSVAAGLSGCWQRAICTHPLRKHTHTPPSVHTSTRVFSVSCSVSC